LRLAAAAILGVVVWSGLRVSSAEAACVPAPGPGVTTTTCDGNFSPADTISAISLSHTGKTGPDGDDAGASFVVGIPPVELNVVSTPGGTGEAGNSLTLNLNNLGTVNVSNAPAILLMSTGGKGGVGGNGIPGGSLLDALIEVFGIDADFGPQPGGQGGAGGNITINSTGTAGVITTIGNLSPGIKAVSQGGRGGTGGNATILGANAHGGGGGKGGDVKITNIAAISTSGDDSAGIIGRSLGGGGGDGGSGWVPIITGGGGGGPSGIGGLVSITHSGNITTGGARSPGIFAQSIGGFAGSGGDGGLLIGFGGDGNSGGAAGKVEVFANSGTISTSGPLSFGIFAQSVGGGGGSGGTGIGLVGIGGGGSPGGAGGEVFVKNVAVIITTNHGSTGIVAQSVGGGGGSGGTGAGVVAIGGSAGDGGAGNKVEVQNLNTITVSGNGADKELGNYGIFAQSVGGGGGSGNFSGGLVTIGGKGGNGGIGGEVVVNNTHNIQAGCDGCQFAGAIYAQSVGGGGGRGGGAAGLVAIGGTGGGGGDGGNVTVTNSGDLIANGQFSRGLFAQSVGGGGGDGGFAGGLFSLGGSGDKGGGGGIVAVTNTGNITTKGPDSAGIFAQSVGGGGGSGGNTLGVGAFVSIAIGGTGGAGGDGRNVEVNKDNNQAVLIQTSGDRSAGILAQSVGGGGGSGGFAISASGGIFGSVSLAFGGTAGEGGKAGDVTVGANGKIVTTGSFSSGIVAEAIGGGGGRGGFAISVAGSNGVGAALAMGGDGGKGGAGGIVTVNNFAAISAGCAGCTQSHGIVASSIGGGGGSGGFSIAAGVGAIGGVGASFGGEGGTGNEGKAVTVTSSVADPFGIKTFGDLSHGIFAQSIGGGGGAGGFSIGAGIGLQAGASLAFGGDGGAGSFAGNVTVTNTGNIGTQGAGSHGILAQSVGGGGGDGGFSIAAGASLNGIAASLSFGGGGGEGAEGKDVTVHHSGVISTTGHSAVGILAQSIGGGGGSGGFSVGVGASLNGAAVTLSMGGDGGTGGSSGVVTVTDIFGSITTRGEQAHGIQAQSIAGGGGSGGFSIAGTLSLKGDSKAISIGGTGGSGQDAGPKNSDVFAVVVNSSAAITTGCSTGAPQNCLAQDRTGAGSHGIFAQSIGGGGGSGGFSGALALTLQGKANASSTGGDGAVGGDGGKVQVTSGGKIVTWADNSIGIFAQSVGGGVGSGAFSIGVGGSLQGEAETKSVGGAGGAAGKGREVDVTVNGSIDTYGALSHGVLAQSVGGGGGSGGFGLGLGVSLKAGSTTNAVGGKGNGGGDGGDVIVTVGAGATIWTRGEGAIGVFAQSVGGGGGSGGFAGALNISGGQGNSAGKAENKVGGSEAGAGAMGGDGGSVTVTNNGTIKTEGTNAHGILAQSVGGGGGNGGFAIAADFDIGGGGKQGSNAEKGGTNSVGGSGGAGGNGGTVMVTNTGNIEVTGKGAFGIFAQSVGGGGGSGGFAGALKIGGELGNVVGGAGGQGGAGGDVTVISSGSIKTTQANSSGVFAQSVGGGGGWGGFSIGLGTGSGSTGLKLGLGNCTLDDCDPLALIPVDGKTGTVTVTINGKTNVTEGSLSYGALLQSIAGGGGAAGTVLEGVLTFTGSDVVVTVGSAGVFGNATKQTSIYAPDTTTSGLGAIGLLSQSIGGGGGVNALVVGSADALVDGTVVLNPNEQDSFIIKVGGLAGGSGTGSGGGFDLTAKGFVETKSHNAIGVLAQTIGGGGGVGNVTIETVVNKGKALQIALGGAQVDGMFNGTSFQGNAGPASQVTVNGKITTSGALSHGLVAQSIGGGGGISNVVFQNGVALTDGTTITLGSGAGGSGGEGGKLTATTFGVATTGAGAMGMVVQSIGGGGSLAGVYSNGKVLGQDGFSLTPVAINASGGGSGGGSGGEVIAFSKGDIHTSGYGAHGIVAQSIGGGGGIAGSGLFTNLEGVPNGLGTDKGAFAGSVGGTGFGGKVEITSTHNVVVMGEHSVGIFGQSHGGSGNGSVLITIDQKSGNGIGLVWAAHGSGAAVQFANGASNQLVTDGTLYAKSTFTDGLPDLNGLAILGGTGDEAIKNVARSPSGPNENQLVAGLGGTLTRTSNIIGNVNLGGGSNSLLNEAGALFITSDFVKLGAGNLLTNEGYLSPGDRGRVQVTAITGDLTQTAAPKGVYYIDIDLNKQNTANPVTDKLNVTGSSVVGGEGPLLLLSIDKTFVDAGYVVVHSDGTTTNSGFVPTLTPAAVGFNFFADVSPDGKDLLVKADKPPFLDLLQNAASGTTDPNVWRMGKGIDNIEKKLATLGPAGVDDPFNYLINLLRLQPDHKALGDAVVTLTPHQAPHLFELTASRATGFLDRTTGCPADWGQGVFAGRRGCVWAEASGGESRRGIVQDSPVNEDHWSSFTFGAQTAVNTNWQLGFGFDATFAHSTQTRQGTWLSGLEGEVYQLNLSATYRSGGFGIGLVAGGSHGFWDAKRFVNINGYSQSYTGFDGIASIGGVDQPVFSEKKTEFEGINGFALSRPEVSAFNPRVRFSYLSEFGNMQIMPFLDIDGHIMGTWKRDETGVGLANLTYPSATETQITFTPGIEVGATVMTATGGGIRGFLRAGVVLTPDSAWTAPTQFIAAPQGLPPIEIIEPFDQAVAKVDAGLMLFSPADGIQVHLNYGGAFGESTTRHEVRGGFAYKF
jgi:hypothetical protein